MTGPAGAPAPRLRDRLAAATGAGRTRVMIEFILQQLHDELGVEGDELHPRARFESLGVDSKRALEFKEMLDEELGCTLRTTLMFDYPTPEALAAHIVRVAFGDADAPAIAAPPEAPTAAHDATGATGAGALDPGGEALSIEERLRRKLEQYEV